MSKLNLIALSSICALVSIALGCDNLAQEDAASVQIANDVMTTGPGAAISLTHAATQSAANTSDSVQTLDNTANLSPEHLNAKVDIKQRLWQDYEYLFSSNATLTGFAPDKHSVKLLKANGVIIEVEISVLCTEDQEYLDSIPDQQRQTMTVN